MVSCGQAVCIVVGRPHHAMEWKMRNLINQGKRSRSRGITRDGQISSACTSRNRTCDTTAQQTTVRPMRHACGEVHVIALSHRATGVSDSSVVSHIVPFASWVSC